MNSHSKKPCLIAVDWGTSNFRAFLLDEKGHIIAKKFAHQGILHQTNEDFEKILQQEINPWLQQHPQLPVLMAGMIGSRHGWMEVPYLLCPLQLCALHQGLRCLANRPSYYIVPGVRYDDAYGRVDVMRGEEVQILGALDPQLSEQLICLPGTHSKWAYVTKGQLMDFTSFMTGEIYMLLAKKSILSKLIETPAGKDMKAFDRGLALANQDDSLLSQLFQVRTQVLSGNLTNMSASSYLSGLLIGQEVKQALRQRTCPTVTLIANPRIARLYARALSKYQIRSCLKAVDIVTCKGLFQVAQAAGIRSS